MEAAVRQDMPRHQREALEAAERQRAATESAIASYENFKKSEEKMIAESRAKQEALNQRITDERKAERKRQKDAAKSVLADAEITSALESLQATPQELARVKELLLLNQHTTYVALNLLHKIRSGEIPLEVPKYDSSWQDAIVKNQGTFGMPVAPKTFEKFTRR